MGGIKLYRNTKIKYLKVLIISNYNINQDYLIKLLSHIKFNNMYLETTSLNLIEDCKEFINSNPDTALSIIDLDDNDDVKAFRLELINYIRNVLKNKTMRIILKGTFSKKDASTTYALKYNINGFINNEALDNDSVTACILTCLRNFQDLYTMNKNRKGLEQIIKSSSTLFRTQSMKKLSLMVLNQLSSIISSKTLSSFMLTKSQNNFYFLCGTGKYGSHLITNNIPSDIIEKLYDAENFKKNRYFDDYFIIFLGEDEANQNIIYFEIPQPLSSITIDLIEIFCTNISAAINNMHLNQELETTEKELIFTLGEISEARSRETGHHVKRVAEYSKILALSYGLSHKEAELIRMASPMHDVGKLAIPDSILNKPAKLTKEEFEIMKTHSRIGYEMLKKSNKRLMKSASIIALEHHEKYNGTGYPYGLSGEDIHLYGRITAVADVFDALGSDRVYKKAWELSKIINYFKEESGQHFDPKIVKIFFKSLHQILEVRDKFPDI
ncbi:hypothetical protein AGR56_04480 [Clostridium sp. DMHC 10]|nr:hypothetical protein AGR56_04480 [Clostridium sp. DMHC 10]